MKKTLLTIVAPLCLCGGLFPQAVQAEEPVFRSIDFYSAASLRRPVEGMRKSVLKADTGVGLRFTDVTLMASLGLPYTPFNAVDTAGALFRDHKALERYGASLHLGGKGRGADATLYAGTLRFGRGLARLKKPSLASASPFRSVSLLSSGIGPALPGFSSAQAPFALALSCRPAGQTGWLPAVQFARWENGDMAGSLSKEWTSSSRPRSVFSLAATGGRFTYGRKLSTAWFPKDRYVPEARYAAADAEICLSLADRFRSSAAFGMAENPFGGPGDAFLWGRSQSSFHYNGFSCNFLAFSADTPDMLLPTGRKLNVRRQLQFNPQLAFVLPAGLLRAGVEIEKNEKLSADKTLFDEYALKMALSFQRGKTRFDAQWGRRLSGTSQAADCQARLAFRYRAEAFTYSASAGYALSAKGQTFTWTQALTPSVLPLSSIKLGGAAVFRDGGYSGGRFNAGITLQGRGPHTRWQGRLSFSTSF